MFNFLRNYRKESTKLNIVVAANLLLKKLFKWQLYFFAFVYFGFVGQLTLSSFGLIMFSIGAGFLPAILGMITYSKTHNFTPLVFLKLFYFLLIIPFQIGAHLSATNNQFWQINILVLLSAVLGIAGKKFLRRMFEDYLLFHVFNKDYFSNFELAGAVDKNHNPVNIDWIYQDVRIRNVEERMAAISNHSVKEKYQDIVECSRLIKQETSKISYWTEASSRKKTKEIDNDLLTLIPEFRAYPLGKFGPSYHLLTHPIIARPRAFEMSSHSMKLSKNKTESETNNYGNEKFK